MEKVIDNNNVKEILSLTSVAVVDFWAPWCGPCRMLAPTVEELAGELDGKVTVAKCNVDDADEVAMNFGIRNIPTLLYFKDGELKDRSVGVVSKQDILTKINNLL